MADTSVVDPAVLLPQLMAENAELKLRIGLPEHECVLQSVLQDQLQRFFDDARRVLDLSVSQSLGLDGSTDGPPSAPPSALIDSLRALSAQNESLLRELTETHATRVSSLTAQVDALAGERDGLLSRVRALEDEAAATAAPPALLCELRGLRAGDERLRAGLSAASARGGEAVAAAGALAGAAADAALALPPVLERLAGENAARRAVAAEAAALRLRLAEAEARGGIAAQAEIARLAEENAAHREGAARLAGENAAARREAVAAAERAAKCAAELAALRETRADAMAAKRRRIEEADAALPVDSVRREAMEFWRSGREELERLRGERDKWRREREQWRAGKAQLERLERSRGAVVEKIAGLAEELGRARDEAQELRSQMTGIAVERDFLRENLAEVLAKQMHKSEIERAAQRIRDAADRPGVNDSGTADGPQCAQQLEKTRQELRNDVARLERRLDKLQKCIALREERITALHTHEAVLRITGEERGEEEEEEEETETETETEKKEKARESRRGDSNARVPLESWTVEETVSLARAHANDAFTAEDEADAENSSPSTRVMTHAALQRAVLSLDAQLSACRRDLESTAADRDAARADLHASETELRGSLHACHAALSSALERNASLSRDAAALQSSYAALQARHTAAATLSQRFAAALHAVLSLQRAGTNAAAALHDALRDERAVSAELTRRAAAAFDATGAEADRVVAALQRVGDAVAQATAQRERARALAEAAHVRALAEAVQRQDERLRALHKGLAEECRALGDGVAQRIAEAVRAGEGEWHARVAQLAKERDALQVQLTAERDILVGMQHTLTVQQKGLLREDEEQDEEEEEEDEDEQTKGESAEGGEVLEIIEKLLVTMAEPNEPHPTAEAISHAMEGENKEERGKEEMRKSTSVEHEIEEQKPAYGEDEEGKEKEQEQEQQHQQEEKEKQEVERREEDEEGEKGTHDYDGEEKSPEE